MEIQLNGTIQMRMVLETTGIIQNGVKAEQLESFTKVQRNRIDVQMNILPSCTQIPRVV